MFCSVLMSIHEEFVSVGLDEIVCSSATSSYTGSSRFALGHVNWNNLNWYIEKCVYSYLEKGCFFLHCLSRKYSVTMHTITSATKTLSRKARRFICKSGIEVFALSVTHGSGDEVGE